MSELRVFTAQDASAKYSVKNGLAPSAGQASYRGPFQGHPNRRAGTGRTVHHICKVRNPFRTADSIPRLRQLRSGLHRSVDSSGAAPHSGLNRRDVRNANSVRGKGHLPTSLSPCESTTYQYTAVFSLFAGRAGVRSAGQPESSAGTRRDRSHHQSQNTLRC